MSVFFLAFFQNLIYEKQLPKNPAYLYWKQKKR